MGDKRWIPVVLVLSVVCVDAYAVLTEIVRALRFSLDPGEWGPRPAYEIPLQIAILVVLGTCVIGVLLRRRVFIWFLFALVAFFATFEILENLAFLDYFYDEPEFRWNWYSTYGIRWALLVLVNAYVLLAPLGQQYFSRQPAPSTFP